MINFSGTNRMRPKASQMERTRFAPWGVHGGHCGGRTAPALVNKGKDNEQRIPKLDILGMSRGDVLELASSGGGGYGDPTERDPQQVREDVLYGFVERDGAERLFQCRFVFRNSGPVRDGRCRNFDVVLNAVGVLAKKTHINIPGQGQHEHGKEIHRHINCRVNPGPLTNPFR